MRKQNEKYSLMLANCKISRRKTDKMIMKKINKIDMLEQNETEIKKKPICC